MELSKPFHRKKIVVIFLACILIFSGLSARVVYLMVFRAAHYSELALDLHQRERKIKAKRGRILDREFWHWKACMRKCFPGRRA